MTTGRSLTFVIVPLPCIHTHTHTRAHRSLGHSGKEVTWQWPLARVTTCGQRVSLHKQPSITAADSSSLGSVVYGWSFFLAEYSPAQADSPSCCCCCCCWSLPNKSSVSSEVPGLPLLEKVTRVHLPQPAYGPCTGEDGVRQCLPGAPSQVSREEVSPLSAHRCTTQGSLAPPH